MKPTPENIVSYAIINIEAWATYKSHKGESAWCRPEIPGALVVPENRTAKGYCDEPCPLYAALNMSYESVVAYMLKKFGINGPENFGNDYYRCRGSLWAQMFISQLKAGTFNFVSVKDGIAVIDAKFFDHEWLESLPELDYADTVLGDDKDFYSLFSRLRRFVEDKAGYAWLGSNITKPTEFFEPIPISEEDKVKYGLAPWWTEVLSFAEAPKSVPFAGEKHFMLKTDPEKWESYGCCYQCARDNQPWYKFVELSSKFMKGEMSCPGEVDDYFKACATSIWPRESAFAENWPKAPFKKLWIDWFAKLAETRIR